MKKILIAFTIFLAVFTVNVGAEDFCATLEPRKTQIEFSYKNSKKTLYIEKISDSKSSAVALCLNPGYSVDPTKNAYYRNNNQLPLIINDRDRRAVQYILNANLGSEIGQVKYLVTQVYFWLRADGMSGFDKTLFKGNVSNALMSYYVEVRHYSNDKSQNLTKEAIDDFEKILNIGTMYMGNLYFYHHKNGGYYQRFLTIITGDPCTEKKTCTDVNNVSHDITSCVNSGKEENYCKSLYCPQNITCTDPTMQDVDITSCVTSCMNGNPSKMTECRVECATQYCPDDANDYVCTDNNGNAHYLSDCGNMDEEACKEHFCSEPPAPVCRGGVLKTIGTPAVCANDNQTHVGHYWQELDGSECGNASEDGEPTRMIGDGSVAWLYCKEEAYQYYPGGIANPVPVGTHIVWPTSTATLNTIWGNLYSLSYEGIKTCKIKFSPNTKSDENMEETFQAHINNINQTVRGIDYVWELENIRTTLAARGKIDSKGLATEDACAFIGDRAYGDQQLKSQRELEEARAELDKCTTVTNTVDQNSEGRNNCKVACANTPHTPETYTDCINYCDGAYPTNNVTTTTSTCTNNEKSQREALVNKKQNELNAINAKINVCKNYINAYNGATEFLNNIVYAGKTKWDPSDLYSFESDTSMSYNDPEYGTTHQLKLSGQSFGCEGCDATEYVRQHSDVLKTYTISDLPSRIGLGAQFQQIVRLIEDRPITITATATYSLPDNLYHYVEKRTNKPSMSIPTVDYIKIGYSNLPISSTASVKNPYDLNITVNSLGENGKFTELANQNPYVCNYSVTNAPTDECVCPEGTKHAGKDLYCKIYGSNSSSTTITCADAQILYCDSDETFDEVCEDDKFCPNDRTIKITSCLNNGKSYDYCVSTLCNINEDFHCPHGTYNDGMNIKPCVFSYMSSGYSKDEAVKICQDTVCPYGGINIIYRTISLRNPFPGKTAGSGVGNTTNKFSLDPHIGRYPGSNWNSVKLVETQILKNRGVEGNAVYQKDPLYTFILDTNTIKEIRKYNDSRENNEGYADFTLDCDTNGVACISKEFVRNEIYGIQKNESVCGSSQHSDFYACSES